MLKIPWLIVVATIFAAISQSAGASEIETGLSAMLARVRPAVVSIRTTTSGIVTSEVLNDPNLRRALGLPDDVLIIQSGGTATGSGVIVDGENGYIVTSRHLLADADDIAVTLADGRSFQASLVGDDTVIDLAVVKIEARRLSALKWGRSSDVKVGDFVVSVGSPLGLSQTASFGMVSGLGRSGLGADEYEDYIQTDAHINPGSSGGALVNLSGELIGITRGIPAESEASTGIGFAVPADIATRIVAELIAHGEYRRGWLGLSVTQAGEEGGGSGAQGLVVTALACNAAAERHGIRLGDVITALNGRPLRTEAAFRNAISVMPADSRFTLDILRGGKAQRLDVLLSDSSDDARLGQGDGFLEAVALGFPVPAASKACAPTGPVLLDVADGSYAHTMGLRAGDYLTAINGKAATSAEQLRNILEGAEGKILLDVLRAGTAYRIEIE